jgi:hypothetical protein
LIFRQVRSIDSALLSAEEQDLVDTDDTDSSFRGGPRNGVYRGGGLQPNYLSMSSSRLDDRRMSSARRATAVSAARRMSTVANVQQQVGCETESIMDMGCMLLISSGNNWFQCCKHIQSINIHVFVKPLEYL